MRLPLPLALLLIFSPLPLHAQHGDPANTVTIVVPGFDPDGATLAGPFGVDIYEDLLGHIGGIAGLSTIQDPGGLAAPDLLTMCDYYGDTPPAYYDAQDHADLAAMDAQFGGGVPRYALIMAKFTREVLERTGAAQANIEGASFGGLISRYMIRHDLEGLVSDGRIARWQTLEGANNGSYISSNDFLNWLWHQFNTHSVDVDHLKYSWVDQHLDSPHDRATHPNYAEMLVGHTASTDDGANSGSFSTILLLNGDWAPNDGVLLNHEGRFGSLDTVAMYRGRVPTQSWHAVDHYGLADFQGAWASIAGFLTGDQRFTVRITGIKLHTTKEGGFWTSMPAETVVTSNAVSQHANASWGYTEPMARRNRHDASAPLHDVPARNSWHTVDQIVFDDMLLPGETGLDLSFVADELDSDPKYDLWEYLLNDYDQIGTLATSIPIASGSWEVTGPDFDLRLTAELIEYPFSRNFWVENSLDVDATVMSSSGGVVELGIDFGRVNSGYSYTIVGTMSGTTPGYDLGNGLTLDINPDFYTQYLLATLNTPLHLDFSGTLDARGRADAVLNSTGGAVDPRAVGRTLHYAVVLVDGGGVFSNTSSPVAVTVQ